MTVTISIVCSYVQKKNKSLSTFVCVKYAYQPSFLEILNIERCVDGEMSSEVYSHTDVLEIPMEFLATVKTERMTLLEKRLGYEHASERHQNNAQLVKTTYPSVITTILNTENMKVFEQR